MPDDIHKFSKIADNNDENPLKKYFLKIQSFFVSEEQVSNPLQGRITEVEEECEELLLELNEVKKSAEKSLPGNLSTQFGFVVDGVIKDLSRIQRESARGHDMPHQAKAGNRYQMWIDQARYVLELKKNFGNPKKVLTYTIRQNIDEFQKKIDRDVQLIEDYFYNALSEGEEQGFHDREEVMKELNPVLEKLNNLKEIVEIDSVDRLIEWKLLADHNRGELFSEALHIIDCGFHRSEFGDINPLFLGEDHAIEKRIYVIEEHLEQLKEASEVLEEENIEDTPYSNLAKQLEMEAREINADPNIKPEEKEKIKKIIQSLGIFRSL